MRYRYGILLLLLAGLAFLGAFLPNTVETRSSSVNLRPAIQNLEQSEQERLAHVAPISWFDGCRIDLTTRWPGLSRTGRAAGIQQSIHLDCPNPIPEEIDIRIGGRFDERTMAVTPDGLIEVPFAASEPGSIFWTVRPQQSGPWEGVLWTYLYLAGKDGGRVEITLSSLPVSGISLALLGLDYSAWITTGWILAGLGMVVIGLTKAIRIIQKTGR